MRRSSEASMKCGRNSTTEKSASLVKLGTDMRGLRIKSAEQRFYRPFFLEQCLEREKVPHQPQYVAYHSIVQPYVRGAARVSCSRLGTVPRLVAAPCVTSDKAGWTNRLQRG